MDEAPIQVAEEPSLPPEVPVKVLAEEEGDGGHPPAPPGHGGDPPGEELPCNDCQAVAEQTGGQEGEIDEGDRHEENEIEAGDEYVQRDSEVLDQSTTTAPTEDWGGIRVDRWGFIVAQQPTGVGGNGGEDEFRKSRRFRELAAKELARSKKWLKMLRHWDRYESVSAQAAQTSAHRQHEGDLAQSSGGA